MTMQDLHDNTFESLESVKLTFQNTNGGDASFLPLKYVDPTLRYTKAKAVANFLQGKSSYRPTSLVAYIARTDVDVVPEDPGDSDPRDVVFHFYVDEGGGERHKEALFVPGVLVPAGTTLQLMGEGIAALLTGGGITFTFRHIGGYKKYR